MSKLEFGLGGGYIFPLFSHKLHRNFLTATLQFRVELDSVFKTTQINQANRIKSKSSLIQHTSSFRQSRKTNQSSKRSSQSQDSLTFQISPPPHEDLHHRRHPGTHHPLHLHIRLLSLPPLQSHHPHRRNHPKPPHPIQKPRLRIHQMRFPWQILAIRWRHLRRHQSRRNAYVPVSGCGVRGV